MRAERRAKTREKMTGMRFPITISAPPSVVSFSRGSLKRAPFLTVLLRPDECVVCVCCAAAAAVQAPTATTATSTTGADGETQHTHGIHTHTRTHTKEIKFASLCTRR